MSHVFSRSLRSVGTLVGTGLLSMGLFTAGCGTASLDHGRGGAFTTLGFDEATLHADGTPSYLAGRMQTQVKDNQAASTLLMGQLGQSYRLSPQTTFAVTKQQSDAEGRSYFRLQQQHAGLPVMGREVVIQTAQDGTVETVLGQLAPELQVAVQPGLAGEPAIRAALATLAQDQGSVLSAPALAIYLDSAGVPSLVYKALVQYRSAEGKKFEELVVSATDGSVLARHNRVYTAGLNRNIYTLMTGGMPGCVSDGSNLPGTSTLNEGGTTTDAPSQRAYDNSGNVYYYYFHMFGRHSYDDMDATLVSTVGLTFDIGSTGMGPCDGGNAAWVPDPFNQMLYGTGSFGGLLLKEMTLGFDVAAHEMSHAVTFATSGLEYQDEPGALNEAMSDIMGASAEAWKNSGGSKTGNPATITTTDKTWKIGEDVAGAIFTMGALRTMSNPTIDKSSKDYYADRVMPGGMDNGGVHFNSGIANLAYYLLVSGGVHPAGKSPGVRVTGIGISKAAHIFYKANVTLLTSMSDFQAARFATARAAELLYGRCGSEWANVHRAWDAVGVPGAWSLCVQPPGGF